MTQTKQEVFDTVVSALIKQGHPSIDTSGGCLYRGPDGLKCAIGHLIPDNVYTPDMENVSADHLAFTKTLGVDVKFVEDLQRAHDGGSCFTFDPIGTDAPDSTPTDWLAQFRSLASRIADHYGLNKDALSNG